MIDVKATQAMLRSIGRALRAQADGVDQAGELLSKEAPGVLPENVAQAAILSTVGALELLKAAVLVDMVRGVKE